MTSQKRKWIYVNKNAGRTSPKPNARRAHGGFCRRVLSGLLVVGAMGLTQMAQAEILSDQTSVTEYWAVVTGMPDLDQKRNPDTWHERRNEGEQYCGPTSAANVLSYLAHAGYGGIDAPTIDFEPIDTEGLTGREEFAAKLANGVKEEAADQFIADLADEMDTGAFAKEDYNAMTWMQRMVLGLPIDPDDYLRGTTKDDLVAGLEDRLPSDFSVVRKGNQRCEDGSNYTITPRRIFKKLQAGNLVILNLGYYRDNGSGEFERDGGHYVVATGIVRSGDDVFRLWYRDPAGDENLVYRDPIDLETLEFGTEEYFAAQMYNSQPLAKASFQSEFRSEVTDLALTEVVMECDDRPRWEMVDRADSFIDAMIVISPPEM